MGEWEKEKRKIGVPGWCSRLNVHFGFSSRHDLRVATESHIGPSAQCGVCMGFSLTLPLTFPPTHTRMHSLSKIKIINL